MRSFSEYLRENHLYDTAMSDMPTAKRLVGIWGTTVWHALKSLQYIIPKEKRSELKAHFIKRVGALAADNTVKWIADVDELYRHYIGLAISECSTFTHAKPLMRKHAFLTPVIAGADGGVQCYAALYLDSGEPKNTFGTSDDALYAKKNGTYNAGYADITGQKGRVAWLEDALKDSDLAKSHHGLLNTLDKKERQFHAEDHWAAKHSQNMVNQVMASQAVFANVAEFARDPWLMQLANKARVEFVTSTACCGGDGCQTYFRLLREYFNAHNVGVPIVIYAFKPWQADEGYCRVYVVGHDGTYVNTGIKWATPNIVDVVLRRTVLEAATTGTVLAPRQRILLNLFFQEQRLMEWVERIHAEIPDATIGYQMFHVLGHALGIDPVYDSWFLRLWMRYADQYGLEHLPMGPAAETDEERELKRLLDDKRVEHRLSLTTGVGSLRNATPGFFGHLYTACAGKSLEEKKTLSLEALDFNP